MLHVPEDTEPKKIKRRTTSLLLPIRHSTNELGMSTVRSSSSGGPFTETVSVRKYSKEPKAYEQPFWTPKKSSEAGAAQQANVMVRKRSSGYGMAMVKTTSLPIISNGRKVAPSVSGSSRRTSVANTPTMGGQRSKPAMLEDIAPSITYHNELKQAIGSGFSTPAPVSNDPATPELQGWISSTLASLPCLRKSVPDALPPKEDLPRASVVSGARDKPASRERAAEQPDADASEGATSVSWMQMCYSEVPSALEMLEWLRASQKGFLPSHMARIKATFDFFKMPNSATVSRESLVTALHHLGHTQVVEEIASKVANEITIYSTLEFDEFVLFLTKFGEHEQSCYMEAFHAIDKDGSGKILKSRLWRLMVSVAFMPLRLLAREVFELFDLTAADTCSFTQFVEMLAIYRYCEGFTTAELNSLYDAFMKRAELSVSHYELPADKLGDVLASFYGPQSLEFVRRIVAEATRPGESASIDANRDESAPRLRFPEVLVWARRVRDIELEVYSDTFKACDREHAGSIDLITFCAATSKLGYTVTKRAICEALTEILGDDEEGTGMSRRVELDVFVDMMLVLRQHEGFCKHEVDELRTPFDRFDEAACGSVKCTDLHDAVHYMGYTTKLRDVKTFLVRMDRREADALDFRGYLRFMRLHREAECEAIQGAFDAHRDANLGGVPTSMARRALAKFVGSGSVRTAMQRTTTCDAAAVLNLDDFVQICDRSRKYHAAQLHRRVGFSEAEVRHFEEIFRKHARSSVIEMPELWKFFLDLGFSPGSADDCDNKLHQKVEAARGAAAAAAGGANAVPGGCGTEGSPVAFPVLLQLLRTIYHRDDKRVADRPAKAVEETGFSEDEVQEFHAVFMRWTARDHVFKEMPSLDTLGTGAPPIIGCDGAISKDGMRRLLRSLGVAPGAERREALELKLEELAACGCVDFADFLRFMRWMLDANIANVQPNASTGQHR